MKQIKLLIAVIATAALSLVATLNALAADSFSPANSLKGTAVSVHPTTHVQVYPISFQLLQGYPGANTNAVSTTGTNFVIAPVTLYQRINASNDVNFVYATNTSATTGWEITVAITANTTNRSVTVPSSWLWKTNANITVTTTNGVVVTNPKLTIVGSNTVGLYKIRAIGTTIHIEGETYRQ